MTILLSLFIENIEIYLSKFNVTNQIYVTDTTVRRSLIISRTNDKTMPKNEKKGPFLSKPKVFLKIQEDFTL